MMQIVHAPRASAILYDLLTSRADPRPWLLPANICPIVPITFYKAHVPFEFVDISAGTLHMDLDQVEGQIKTRKYGGLLYAHTYGEESTPEDFFQSIKSSSPDVFILDDRCLCIPNVEPPADANADVTMYSTGYAKFAELNYGGYAFLKNDVGCQPSRLPFNPKDHEDVERAYKQAIQNGLRFEYKDSDWLETNGGLLTWYDYRQQVQNNLAGSVKSRMEINKIYSEDLPAEIQLPQSYQNWRFNIRVKNKARVLDAIFAAGLFASSHYASLAGIMSDRFAPCAQSLAGDVINLFNDHHFTTTQAKTACKIILENLT